MAELFIIELTQSAEADLGWFELYAQRIIMDGIELHLRHQPLISTKRTKQLRPNPVAERELRLGDYRILYDVDETDRLVIVQVVGEKRGNRLLVQGKEYVAHESDRT